MTLGPILTTERMILTPVAVTDFEDLRILWRDEAFTRAISGRSLTSEEVWFRLLRDIGHWTVLGHGAWSMRLKTDGAYVGGVGVVDYHRDLDPPFDAPEFAWGVGGAFQGKGFAREGADAVLAWVDGVFASPRTVCMISPDNAPSLKLAARVGFQPYGEGLYKDSPVRLLQRRRP